MAQHENIKRYRLIIEKTQRGFPTLKEIIEHLTILGLDVSERTLQRDFKTLRERFDVEITYDRNRRGYFLEHANFNDVEQFVRFLEILLTADLLEQSLKESKDTLRHIDFESAGMQCGSHLLKDLLRALREKREVEFAHESFFREHKKKYRVRPFLLKEYLNRFYLVGQVPDLKGKGKERFRTFGLDRIIDLQVTDRFFNRDRDVNPKYFFDNVIGLTYSTGNLLEDVVLSFSPRQGKYIKTLPMHDSQEVLIDDDQELRIKLQVKPNFELIQKILMHGQHVKVLEPDSLKDQIKKTLEKAVEQYEQQAY